MTSHSEILARYHIEPKKSLGQNFLTQDSILDGIAGVSEVTGKHIIEVGPGYGALTEKLLALNPASLTLVEYDTKMVEILEDRLKRGDFPLNGATEFTIHRGDVLAFHPVRESVIIANIPYYITSPILFRFLYEVDFTPSEMVILMQKEVGDKIRETKEFGRSYFSLACKRKCSSIKECFKVAAGNFFPPPKVESTVLHFSNIIKKNSINGSGDEGKSNNIPQNISQDTDFLSAISKGFAHPRKFVVSNLAQGDSTQKNRYIELFKELGISEQARPAELCMEDWERVIERISKNT